MKAISNTVLLVLIIAVVAIAIFSRFQGIMAIKAIEKFRKLDSLKDVSISHKIDSLNASQDSLRAELEIVSKRQNKRDHAINKIRNSFDSVVVNRPDF